MARSQTISPALRKKAKRQKWLPLLLTFLEALRIQSKEVASIDDDRGGSELDLWESQERFLETLCDGLEDGIHEFCVLKSRQLGITTIGLAIVLFWLAVNPRMIGCLVADSDGNSATFREQIATIMKSFPEDFIGDSFEITQNNKYFITFSNGSRLDLLVAGKQKTNWAESKGYALAWLCLAAGTPVVICDGRIVPVERVEAGTKILTHTGAIGTVELVASKPNGDHELIEITPWMGQAISVTPDHKMPTQRGLVHAEDLKLSDWLVMPIRRITGEPPTFRLPPSRNQQLHHGPPAAGADKSITLNEEVGFAIGYYLAEGSVLHASFNGNPCGLTFTRHRDERGYADRAISALASFTTGSRGIKDRPNSFTSQDTIYGSPLAQWISDKFGEKDNKRIPDDSFTWGLPFCRGLIVGLLSGDGSKTCRTEDGYQKEHISLSTTRSSIAMQLRDLVASFGIGWASMIFIPAGERYGRNCAEQWTVRWHGSAAADLRALIGLPTLDKDHWNTHRKYRMDDMSVWIKLRKLKRVQHDGDVWNIAIDHADHTYRTPYAASGNSEVAKYGKQEGIDSFKETLAQTHPNRLVIYESTANGFANPFKDLWDSFGDDPYTKRRVFIGWWAKQANSISKKDRRYSIYGRVGPNGEEAELIKQVADLYGYVITMEQLAWYRWRQSDKSAAEGSLEQNQPYTENQAFIQPGFSFFQMRLIQRVYEALDQDPPPMAGYTFVIGNDIFATRMEQITEQSQIDLVDLRIWEEPRPDGIYVIGCDPAYGRTEWADRHVISVWRAYADRLVQVAEYATAEVETHHCAWVLAYLAGAYRDCIINLELAGPGRAILRELDQTRDRMKAEIYAAKVRNLEWDDFLDQARWYLYHRPDSPGPGFAFAFETTWRTKMEILNQLRDSFTTDILDIRSMHMVNEMRSIVQTRSDIAPEAPGRYKDDRVFAAALANRAWIDQLRSRLIQEGATYEIVTAGENGELSVTQQMVKRMVYDFFRSAEERQNAPHEPSWLEDRGFA